MSRIMFQDDFKKWCWMISLLFEFASAFAGLLMKLQYYLMLHFLSIVYANMLSKQLLFQLLKGILSYWIIKIRVDTVLVLNWVLQSKFKFNWNELFFY